MGTDTRPAPPSSRPSDGGLVSKAANYQARQARYHEIGIPGVLLPAEQGFSTRHSCH